MFYFIIFHIKDQNQLAGLRGYVNSDDEIHIVGLCTDICVISNALLLRAKFPNLHIYVHENCCAGTSKEAHNAAIKVMKSCQIEVI